MVGNISPGDSNAVYHSNIQQRIYCKNKKSKMLFKYVSKHLMISWGPRAPSGSVPEQHRV